RPSAPASRPAAPAPRRAPAPTAPPPPRPSPPRVPEWPGRSACRGTRSTAATAAAVVRCPAASEALERPPHLVDARVPVALGLRLAPLLRRHVHHRRAGTRLRWMARGPRGLALRGEHVDAPVLVARRGLGRTRRDGRLAGRVAGGGVR